MNEKELKDFLEVTILENLKKVEVQTRENLSKILGGEIHPDVFSVDFEIHSYIYDEITIMAYAMDDEFCQYDSEEEHLWGATIPLFKGLKVKSNMVKDFREFIEEQFDNMKDSADLDKHFELVIIKWFENILEDFDFKNKPADFYISKHDPVKVYDLKNKEFVRR